MEDKRENRRITYGETHGLSIPQVDKYGIGIPLSYLTLIWGRITILWRCISHWLIIASFP